MPNRNGTGPEGKGPKTGRGKGNCQNKQTNTPEKITPSLKEIRRKRMRRIRQPK